MNYLQLRCPNCGSLIEATDINLDNVLAKCSTCNTVFSFAEDINVAPPGQKKTEVAMPKGIDVLKLRSELDVQISWRQSSASSTFFVIFTIFWNAIVFPFAFYAIVSGELFMLLMLSLHLAVGIGFLYYTLAIFLNTTYINVNTRELTIEHKPLKVIGRPNRNLPISDIEQVFMERYVSSRTNGRPDFAFSVNAVLKNKNRLPLVKGLRHPDQGLFLEQEIEQFLNIKDRPVEEEWRG